jgi:hypothetical protein
VKTFESVNSFYLLATFTKPATMIEYENGLGLSFPPGSMVTSTIDEEIDRYLKRTPLKSITARAKMAKNRR